MGLLLVASIMSNNTLAVNYVADLLPLHIKPDKKTFEDEGESSSVAPKEVKKYEVSGNVLYDVQAGKKVKLYEISQYARSGMQVSSDGTLIAYVSENKEEPITVIVSIESIRSKGQDAPKILVKGNYPLFDPNSRFLITERNSGTVKDPVDVTYIYNLAQLLKKGHSKPEVLVGAYAGMSPDGSFIVTKASDERRDPPFRTYIYRLDNAKIIKKLPGDSPVFSPNSEFIVTYNQNGAFKVTGDIPSYYLYNIKTNNMVQKQVKGGKSSVMDNPIFSSDSQFLFTQSFYPKHETYLHDTKTGAYLFNFEGNEPKLNAKDNVLLTSIQRTKKPTEILSYNVEFLESKEVHNFIEGELTPKQELFFKLLNKWKEINHGQSIKLADIAKSQETPTIFSALDPDKDILQQLQKGLRDLFDPIITQNIIEKYKIIDAQ